MTMTYTNYTSFASVVAHYESIKPVREKGYGTSRNIRPIGDRNRKWERIVKLSRNCYALSIGYHRGDPTFSYWRNSSVGKMEYYAPIVWRKHKDGVESVRIMNMTGPDNGCDPSRYDFINRHTPRGLHFMQGNARQYISKSGLYEDKIFLAKGKTVTADEQKYYEEGSPQHRKKWRQRKDDNAALVFTRDGGNWIHDTTTGKEIPKNPQVNKELKAKYKDALRKFFEWGMTMSPLLPLDQQYIMGRMDELRKHFYPTTGYQPWNPDWSRAILVDEDHPMRLHLWVQFASQSNVYGWAFNQTYAVKEVHTEDDLRRVRARFNSFINTNAGFMKQ